MNKKASMSAAILLAASVAHAAGLAGVSMPDTAAAPGKTLRLNGLGLRTKLLFKIYVGGLYLENPTPEAARAISSDEGKRVVMHFLYKKVTKKQLDEAWEEGFRENTPSLSAAVKADLAKFESWMGDVSSGQEIVLTYEPGKGTTVQFAGEEKGTIPGEDFMRALWGVFLGPHPPTEDLKKGMLGGK
ncbi:MAG TPA: chalcone isomerase family protein [Thermoanaerobaculia bacterium]|nr:chalcone isomerase family protein [Thermoanaerobaculia bacterium]